MTREEINEEQQKRISRENNLEKTKKIIIISLKLIFIFSIIIITFLSYTTYISTVKISVREYRITDSKIPASFNGIKILHFSDLHYGSTMREENMKEIKRIINEIKPDIIVYTGDLINNQYKISNEEKDKISKYFSELHSTLGKYAVLGDEDNTDITTILKQGDFNTLNNDYDLIYQDDNQPIMIVGISSLLSKNNNIEQAYSYFTQENSNSNIYTIALIHEPDMANEIVDSHDNTDLIMAGHSHNGTIRTPFKHLPLERKKGAKTFNQDYYELNDTKLFISGGLGTSGTLSIRLFCRPSINLYRLSNN